MNTPTLILVAGLSASGKTTLAKKISRHFNMPCICKDELKELLFDSLGWSDREWSKKMGGATFPLIDYILRQELAHGRSLVVECNFRPEYDNKRFQALQKEYGVVMVQVLCTAKGEVLLRRFEERAQTSERHPGHLDAYNSDEFRDMFLRGKSEPLDVQGELITVDTTDFATVDEQAIFERIASALPPQAHSV